MDVNSERFDRATLLQLIDDDVSLLGELLVSAANMKNQIEELSFLIRESDESAVKTAAHKLKGAALALTFNRLAGFAKLIETRADAEPADLALIQREMVAEWVELERIIEAELRCL